jgi:hypothetical protein
MGTYINYFLTKLVTEMEKESEKGADSRRNNIDDNNNQESTAEVLEKGDIFFFYRPKTKIVDGSGDVKSIEDIRRFFMVTATTTAANTENEQQQQFDGTNGKTPKEEESQRYRLFVIGKKSLPEIRTSEARRSERYWAKVGGIFENPQELTSELLSDEFRKGDAARPVGEGKYAIVKHQDHAELAYVLENARGARRGSEGIRHRKGSKLYCFYYQPKSPCPLRISKF